MPLSPAEELELQELERLEAIYSGPEPVNLIGASDQPNLQIPLSPAEELELQELERLERGIQSTPEPYSASNPAPGAELSPPMGDTPWYEMGAGYLNNQPSQATPSPQVLSPHLPFPTNTAGAALTGQAVGRGAADLAGSVGDVSTMVGSSINNIVDMTGIPKALTGQDLGEFTLTKPIGSDNIAENFSSLAESAGYPIQNPNELEPSGKKLYDMLRFASGSGMGGLGAAAGAGKATSTAGKAFTAPYVDAPVRQVVQETVAGAGAGLGSNMAQENNPDSALAQIVGPLLGGMAASSGFNTATSPVSGAYNRSKIDLPNGSSEQRRTVQGASDVMKSMADNPAMASNKIKDSMIDTQEGGITNLTSGIASDDVGLSFIEKNRRMADSLPYERRDQAIRTDVSDSVSGLRDVKADVTAPQKAAQLSKDSQLSTAKTEADQALSNVSKAEQSKIELDRDTEALVSPVKGELGREQVNSGVLDEQISSALKERTKIKNDGFEKAAGDETVDITPVSESIDKVTSELNKLSLQGSGLPEGFINRVKGLMPDIKRTESSLLDSEGKKILKEVNEGGSGQASLKDVSKVRGEIGRAIDKARSAGNIELKDSLTVLKNDINKMIDDIPSFDEPRNYYKDEYATLFAQGRGKQWRDNKYKSEKGTGGDDPSNTADFFLKSTRNSAEDLKRIIDIAPDPKTAENAVEKYLAGSLAAQLGNKASPKVIAKWISQNSDQLDQFPDVKKKFEELQTKAGSKEIQRDSLKVEIDKLTNDFKRAEDNIKETERRINKGVLGTLIDEDPDQYIKSIMGSKGRDKKIVEIKELIEGNESAQKGLKRAVTEYFMDTVTGTNVKLTDGEEGPLLYAAIAKMMKKDEKFLSEVYDPEEMAVIRRAQRTLGAYGNLGRRGQASSSATLENLNNNKAMKVALETGLRIKYGVLKAGGLMKTLSSAADLLPDGHVSKVGRLVSQAMLDPELATHLLDAKQLTVGKTKWNRELHHLLGVASGGREVTDDDSEE